MTDDGAHMEGLPRDGFLAALRGDLATRAATIAPTSMVEARTIGVLADTHCANPEDLPEAAMRALRGVDLIVHCGDIGTRALLARLAAIAPVLAVRSPLDGPADGVMVFDGPRIIGAGAVCIGVTPHADEEALADGASTIFGVPVDVVLSGTTHIGSMRHVGELLAVDPGSPTMPADGRATVARLTLDPAPHAEIIELEG